MVVNVVFDDGFGFVGKMWISWSVVAVIVNVGNARVYVFALQWV